MSSPQPQSRRDRNKQHKLDRITDAATVLFAGRSVDEVTTQEIADAADVATGTLFLYAKTKAELLLMVQNKFYAIALEDGITAGDRQSNPVDAVRAVVRPIVACNRKHAGNGKAYLREVVFGDPTEPNNKHALGLFAQTEAALAAALVRTMGITNDDATRRAHVVLSVMLTSLAASAPLDRTVDEIVDEIAKFMQPVLT